VQELNTVSGSGCGYEKIELRKEGNKAGYFEILPQARITDYSG